VRRLENKQDLTLKASEVHHKIKKNQLKGTSIQEISEREDLASKLLNTQKLFGNHSMHQFNFSQTTSGMNTPSNQIPML
jgi:hypothetical protein